EGDERQGLQGRDQTEIRRGTRGRRHAPDRRRQEAPDECEQERALQRMAIEREPVIEHAADRLRRVRLLVHDPPYLSIPRLIAQRQYFIPAARTQATRRRSGASFRPVQPARRSGGAAGRSGAPGSSCARASRKALNLRRYWAGVRPTFRRNSREKKLASP